MPKYRAVIERMTVSHEIVEFTAPGIIAAAQHANAIANDRGKQNMRGVTIIATFADDPSATTRDDVVQLIDKD